MKSAVNKEYLNENFLKKSGDDYDLKQNIIKNCEPYYDGLFDNNSLVSKAFVDAEIAKIPHVAAATDVLKLDGTKAMTGALNMNNNEIKNLKDPVNDQDAGTKKYVDGEIAKIPHIAAATDVLKLDGSKAMTGNLDLGTYSITNLKDPQSSDTSHAASVNYVTDAILNSNFTIIGEISDKIKESEEKSIQAVQ